MKNLLGDSLPHSELRGHMEPRLRDDGGLKRRELLKASMVIGAGVVGQMMVPSAASAQAPPQQNIAPAKSGKGQLTEQQVLITPVSVFTRRVGSARCAMELPVPGMAVGWLAPAQGCHSKTTSPRSSG